jgi:hypothetical protein
MKEMLSSFQRAPPAGLYSLPDYQPNSCSDGHGKSAPEGNADRGFHNVCTSSLGAYGTQHSQIGQ